jgi:cyclophilin family peptidyl-prolyl cis-trans isomerase/HEAT repeat protein
MALGRIQDAAALELLLPRLDDPDSGVVAQATWAIRQLQGLSESQRHAAQGALTLKLELEEKEELWSYLEALRPHAGPAAVDPVAKWLAAGLLAGMGSRARPPLVEGMAALVLGELNTERSIRALASVGDLTTREEGAAWRLAAAMALHPDSTFLEPLRSLTTHAHPYARAAGARALARHSDRAGLERIYPLLSDFDWKVRASALRALGDIGAEAARAYCAAMSGDSHPLVREAALIALEKLGAGEQWSLAAELLSDPVPAVRLTALRVVADARGADARAAWETARVDSIDFVRSEALRSAYDVLDADEATTHLLEILNSPVVRERGTAASVLGAHTADIPAARRAAIRAALEAGLQDEDFVVASEAASALGQLGDGAAVSALVDAYRQHDADHNDVDVRWAAVAALLELTETTEGAAQDQLESFFESAIQDADGRVGHDARRGVARLRDEEEPQPQPPRQRDVAAPPATWPEIDLGRVRVRLATRHGEAIIELHGDDYPRTVGSFLRNVDSGFYDDGVFHRVVPAFVVQGGCPRGDGWGDAGAFLPCEYGDLRYDRAGVVGMAHAGRDTGGSQFFITHLPVPRLDGRYTAFGRVVEGMEIVERIVRGDRFRVERLPKTTP